MKVAILCFFLGLLVAIVPFFYVTSTCNIFPCPYIYPDEISYKPASLFILAIVFLLISLFRILKLNIEEKSERLTINDFAENKYEGAYFSFAKNKHEAIYLDFIEIKHEGF